MLDLEAAAAWIDEQLGLAGSTRTGPVESVRVRPWGEVAKADTDQGTVWLKVPGRTTAFEVGLYELLGRTAPEAILVPVAVDAQRGWVLLPEGGPPIGETADGPELIAGLVRALDRYGKLQRTLADHVPEILELGVADMRPAAMPGRFAEAVAAGERYVAQRGDEGDRATLERVRDERGRFTDLCGALGSRPGGASLDHNDLHPWNILGDARKPSSLRFYDWGDSVVAHPFAATLVPLGFVKRLAPADLERARDAYLEPFGDVAPHGELVETLEIACRVAKVARALTWERALRAGEDADVDPDFARAPLATLASFLDHSYLGGA
jgi:Phosphotransferase enzyme family